MMAHGTRMRWLPAILLLGALALSSCGYTPNSDTTWTPAKAKKVILDYERDKARGHFGTSGPSALGIPMESRIIVKDGHFADSYLSSRHYIRQTPGGYPIYRYVSGLRKVRFQDIETVRMEWIPASPVATVFSALIAGPFLYDKELVVKDGVPVPRTHREHMRYRYNRLNFGGSGKKAWWNLLPMWIFCVRPFLHSDDLGEAILFLKRRADPHPTTPLHVAAREGDVADAQALLARGADPNATRHNGDTPLHLAAVAGHAGVAGVLAARGAGLDARKPDGSTPLHLAAAMGSTAVVELLLAKGADVNAKTTDGRTPLHRAALWGRGEIVSILIARGADVNARTARGVTPLALARRHHPGVVEILRRHGAKESPP